MATVSAQISSVRSFSSITALKSSRRSPRVSLQCRRRLACRASGEEDDKSAYPQAAASSAPGLYTGYIKKDSAGIAVIDVVEPTVYVEGSGSRLERDSTSTPAILGGVLALIGAGAALAFLSSNTSQLEAGLTLSQYVDKFSAEITAAGTVEAPAVVEEITIVEAAAPALVIDQPAAEAEEIVSPVEIEAVQVFEIVPVPEPEPAVQAIIAEPEEDLSPVEIEAVQVFEIVPVAEPEPVVKAVVAEPVVEAIVAEPVVEAVVAEPEDLSSVEIEAVQVFEIIPIPEPEPALQAAIEQPEEQEIVAAAVVEEGPIAETAAIDDSILEAESE